MFRFINTQEETVKQEVKLTHVKIAFWKILKSSHSPILTPD